MDAKRVLRRLLFSAVCLAAVAGGGMEAEIREKESGDAPSVFSGEAEIVRIDSFEALCSFSETVAGAEGGYTGEVWLMCDIEAEEGFEPIGSPEHMFLGTFDGRGNEISGLATEEGAFQGLFGYVGRGGCVRNLTVRNACISGSRYTGGIAGYSAGRIENCRVLGGRIEGKGIGVFSSATGGIAGLSNGEVENCLVRATRVSGGRNTGGIVGNQCAGKTVRCISGGQVFSREKGQAQAGGIIGGLQTGGEVIGCISCMDVRAPGGSWAGGVVGAVLSGKVRECVFLGRIEGREAGGVTGYAGRSSSVIACRYRFGLTPGVGEGKEAGVSRMAPGSAEERLAEALMESFRAGCAEVIPSFRLTTTLV